MHRADPDMSNREEIRSTLVEVSALAIPGAKIEVDCVAVLPA